MYRYTQKRPTNVQKRPTDAQKRPTNAQRRPTNAQKVCTGNDTRLCDHDLLVLPPSPLSLHGAYHLLLLLMYVAYSVLVSLYLSVCLSVCLSRYPRSLPTCVRFERACVFARVDVCVRAHEHCIVRIHARASRLFKIQSNTGLPTTPTPISIHASCATVFTTVFTTVR